MLQSRWFEWFHHMLQGSTILSCMLVLETVSKGSLKSMFYLQEYVYPMTYIPKTFYRELFLIYIVGRDAIAWLAMIM